MAGGKERITPMANTRRLLLYQNCLAMMQLYKHHQQRHLASR